MGYNDGLPPALARGGAVGLRGRRALVVGAVSMDYTTIDITDVPDVKVGDVVLVFGHSGTDVLPVHDQARAAGIGNYAVTCAVGKRVQRTYRTAAPAVNLA